MKNFIGVIVGFIVFLFLIFVVDKAIVNAILNAIPASVGEWVGLIKIGLWFLILWLTLGLAFAISIFLGTLVGVTGNNVTIKRWKRKIKSRLR